MNTPDFSMTTLEAAMANALASVKIQVDQFNTQAKVDYLTKFNNWVLNRSAGRDTSDPPKPPMAYEVGFFNDPTNAKAVWAYPKQGTTTPVCEMPPIPAIKDPHVGGGIGIRLSGSAFFQCLEGDTSPDGAIVPSTSKDGVSGLFRKMASPFGSNPSTGVVGGWWVLIG